MSRKDSFGEKKSPRSEPRIEDFAVFLVDTSLYRTAGFIKDALAQSPYIFVIFRAIPTKMYEEIVMK